MSHPQRPLPINSIFRFSQVDLLKTLRPLADRVTHTSLLFETLNFVHLNKMTSCVIQVSLSE